MNKLILVFMMFVGITLFLTSCEEEPTGPGKLEIKVTILTTDGDPAVNAKLNLAKSEKLMNQGLFVIEDLSSNLEGFIILDSIEPMTYYYQCTTVSKPHYTAQGTITVNPGETCKNTIVLMEL